MSFRTMKAWQHKTAFVLRRRGVANCQSGAGAVKLAQTVISPTYRGLFCSEIQIFLQLARRHTFLSDEQVRSCLHQV